MLLNEQFKTIFIVIATNFSYQITMNNDLLTTGIGWRILTFLKLNDVSGNKMAAELGMSGPGFMKSCRKDSLKLKDFVGICRYFGFTMDEMMDRLETQDYFDYWTLVLKKPAKDYVIMIREGSEPTPPSE